MNLRAPQVLVVEDDLDLLSLMCTFLRLGGIEVKDAADGAEAIDHLLRGRPDLLVLDLGLPLVPGEEVACRARQLYGASLPILVVSATGRTAQSTLAAGADSYLCKPFNQADFVQRSLELLARAKAKADAVPDVPSSDTDRSV